ncbi:MAG: hypothetical protein AB7G75_31875 [Candidatus Binatia bacterium]
MKVPSPRLREPAQLWIWGIITLLVFLCVPYFSAGTYLPLVLGIPLWFLVVLVASLLLTGFTVYVVLRQWRLAPTILDEDEDSS